MAMTRPSDIFQPEVVCGLVDERLFAETSLLSSGYIVDARKNVSANVKGDKITVIRTEEVLTNKGVQTNARDGVALDADALKFASDEYNVSSKMVCYDMDEFAMTLLNQIKDANAHVAGEVMQRSAAHIQEALINAGVQGGIEFADRENTISWKGLRRAITKSWGEKMDKLGAPLLIVHPNVMYDLTCTEQAMKSGLFGGNSIITSGKIYQFAGLNVMQLSAIPLVGDKYQNLIITPNALNYYQDEAMGYFEQRKAHTTLWQLDWDFRYAAWLSKNRPNGAIVYQVASKIDEPDSESE